MPGTIICPEASPNGTDFQVKVYQMSSRKMSCLWSSAILFVDRNREINNVI